MIRDERHQRFMRLFLDSQQGIRAFLQAATRDVHATDDLLQEVSTVLWEKFDRFDPERPFAAWAIGIARLQILKWRTAHARSREVFSPGTLELLERSAVAEAGWWTDHRTALRTCLGRLAERARRAVELRYREMLPVAEVAARLRKSVAAAEMMLVRIRRSLRSCIEGEMAGDRS